MSLSFFAKEKQKKERMEAQKEFFLQIGDKVCAPTSTDSRSSLSSGMVTNIYVSASGQKSYKVRFDERDLGQVIQGESLVMKEISRS